MKRYLVVYPQHSGIAQLNNIGVFHEDTPEEAESAAQELWNTLARLKVIDLGKIQDGWSYFC